VARLIGDELEQQEAQLAAAEHPPTRSAAAAATTFFVPAEASTKWAAAKRATPSAPAELGGLKHRQLGEAMSVVTVTAFVISIRAHLR
jgi:hypothetical protein